MKNQIHGEIGIADSTNDAEKVESYFMDKGMRQDAESFSADFVYMFYIGSPQEKI